MGRKSLFWAATHPCFDLNKGGYTCECGHRSSKVSEHNEHVKSAHIDDWEFCERVLSWKQFKKLFPKKFERMFPND